LEKKVAGKEENTNCQKCHIQILFNVINSRIPGLTGSRTLLIIKIIKARLKNELDDDFLRNNLIVYVEKDFVSQFGIVSIVD
jgi:hypothetical protein